MSRLRRDKQRDSEERCRVQAARGGEEGNGIGAAKVYK